MEYLVPHKTYPGMFYVRYPTRGRSRNFFNKTRASYYAISLWDTCVKPVKVGQLAFDKTENYRNRKLSSESSQS